jgi:hypothetical protein
MNIMTAVVHKHALEPVDTTEHILLVHVIILDLQVVVRALAIPLIAAAKYVMIIAANAAALLVQHQCAILVVMALVVVDFAYASRAHAHVSRKIVSVKSMDI